MESPPSGLSGVLGVEEVKHLSAPGALPTLKPLLGTPHFSREHLVGHRLNQHLGLVFNVDPVVGDLISQKLECEFWCIYRAKKV